MGLPPLKLWCRLYGHHKEQEENVEVRGNCVKWYCREQLDSKHFMRIIRKEKMHQNWGLFTLNIFTHHICMTELHITVCQINP